MNTLIPKIKKPPTPAAQIKKLERDLEYAKTMLRIDIHAVERSKARIAQLEAEIQKVKECLNPSLPL